MNTITNAEIDLVSTITSKQVTHSVEYPNVLTIDDVQLNDNCWSSPTSNLMLVKEKNSWGAYLNSDLITTNSSIAGNLSLYAEEGWCEIVSDELHNASLEQILDFLKNKMGVVFRIPDSEDSQGFIQNSFCYMQENTISIFYEYQGPSTLVTLEVYKFSGEIVKRLEIEEIESGWVMNSWDGKNDDSHVCEDGFYLFKIRAAQTTGEINKVIVFHKNFEAQK